MSRSIEKQHRLWFCFCEFNNAIVAGLFTRLLGCVKGAILVLVGIVLYTLLVGAGLSVVREALMEADVPVTKAETGQVVDLDEGARG
jgi:hypothetical protein